MRTEIKKFAEERGIPCLVHFTRWENLDGIIENGLCPRLLLECLPYDAAINDKKRLDGRIDSVSLSIAFPNYRMFYKYRIHHWQHGGAVLEIHPSVLWEYECAFCRHNAADSRILRTNIDSLKTIEAFKGMYYDKIKLMNELDNILKSIIESEDPAIKKYGASFNSVEKDDYNDNRNITSLTQDNTNNLKPYDPTDPQAEVLVFDIIPPDKIIAVAFEDNRLLNKFKAKHPNIKAVLNKEYFSKRCYVRRKYWKPDIECVCKKKGE